MHDKTRKITCEEAETFFAHQLLAELYFSSTPEQKPPFKNPRSTTNKTHTNGCKNAASPLVQISAIP